MKLKSTGVAISLLLGVSAASAIVVQNIGPATLTYDETTTLASLTSWSGSGGNYSFFWTIPNTAAVFSSGPLATSTINLPSFDLTPNSGWTLSGNVKISLGNLAYTEVGGATANIVPAAHIYVDTMPLGVISGFVTKVPTFVTAGVSMGYFGQSINLPIGSFNSFAVSAASLTMSVGGGSFSSITANPQNQLAVSFNAMPVAEPETYATLLSGLAVIGWFAKRRRNI